MIGAWNIRYPQLLMYSMPKPCSEMPVTAPCWPGSGKRADLLADVTMQRQRESLALVSKDDLADAGPLRPALRGGS